MAAPLTTGPVFRGWCNTRCDEQVDEMPTAAAVSESPSTSSVVDEVFFILKSTLQVTTTIAAAAAATSPCGCIFRMMDI